jgi:CBS domain-containing protein
LAFLLGFLGLFGNPLLIFIAIFVYIAAGGEARMSAFSEAARGLTVGDAMETRFNAIPIDATLAEAIETLLATAQHEFPVVDAFGKPVGLLAREDIYAALKSHGLVTVLDRLNGSQAAALAVTDSDGTLLGLLTRQNLGEMMLIMTLRPDWRFDRS